VLDVERDTVTEELLAAGELVVAAIVVLFVADIEVVNDDEFEETPEFVLTDDAVDVVLIVAVWEDVEPETVDVAEVERDVVEEAVDLEEVEELDEADVVVVEDPAAYVKSMLAVEPYESETLITYVPLVHVGLPPAYVE